MPESRWLFDPAGRVRRGGSAAEYAFRPKLEVFVREVLQNAKDQSVGGRVDVHFELISLKAAALEQFLEALEWDRVRPHLEAAGAGSPNAAFLKRGLRQLEEQRRLLLLRVDDSGTGGLAGGDFEPDQPFTCLCVDELFSKKESAGAGGSYGLGKSVLWRFSQFATVLFSSYPLVLPAGKRGLRVFGRMQLPWHGCGGRNFDGTSWFGKSTTREGREVAASWWDTESEAMAGALHLARPATPGASMLVVGFQSPAEEALDDAELCSALCKAAERHFWPVLRGQTPRLGVTARLLDAHSGAVLQEARAGVAPHVRPLSRCLDALEDGTTVDVLGQPGEVAAVEIPVNLPAGLDGAHAVDGRLTLCVQLAQSAVVPYCNEVAEVRGFGMVVRSRELRSLSLSARPFHAVLVCGTLRGQTSADDAIEKFLRLAEPPEHDCWTSTPRLRDAYRRGYVSMLDRLEKDVADAIRRLVSQATAVGDEGPQQLARLFPIRGVGPERRVHAFAVTSREAFLVHGAWVFSGEVKRTGGSGPWTAEVALRLSMDDGGVGDSIVASASSTQGQVTVSNGIATIAVPATCFRVRFEGEGCGGDLIPDADLVAVRLDVTARSVDTATQG